MNAAAAAAVAAIAWVASAAITLAVLAVVLYGAVDARRALLERPLRQVRSLGGQIWAAGRARVPSLLHDDDTAAWPTDDWRAGQ